MTHCNTSRQQGFTILETIIGMGILVIVSSALYLAYSNTLDIVSSGQFHSAAANLIESEVEIIRNMRYEDIGIAGGIPSGKLLATKSISLDNVAFTINTAVRNVDDPFDGTASGSPLDPDPSDYKLIEFVVMCPDCPGLGVVELTTTIAPRNLENPQRLGTLLIRSINAIGAPLGGATVTIVNNNVVPPVNLVDTTDVNGELLFTGIATDSAGYRVTVSRVGHSTERTYPPGDASNPNPTKPDLTIAEEQLTTATFSIDETGSITFQSLDSTCVGDPNVDFLLTGGKRIGVTPDVFKYSSNHQTNGSGSLLLNALEWDAYNVIPTDATRHIAASSHPSPISLDPADTMTVTWMMVPAVENGLLIQVVDESGQPINDASVQLSSGSYDVTLMSGQFPWTQTDWSGVQYSDQSGGISASNTLTLQPSGGPYATSSYEWLESETIDLGSTDTTLFSLSWNPVSQPPETGNNSVRFQLAANNDDTTWSYVGPDGTANTYFTNPETSTPSLLNDNRYIRYRIEIMTEDSGATPSIDDVTITFRSDCVPGGGAFFNNLIADHYDVAVTKSGFQDHFETDVSAFSTWQEHIIELSQ